MMAFMIAKSALPGLVLIAFPALAAAQNAAARNIAPLAINDETVGILRQH